MSRYVDHDRDVGVTENQQSSRAPGAQGRIDGSVVGGASTKPGARQGTAVANDIASPRHRLAAILDRASQGKPTMGEFIERLEKDGVAVLPSLQSGGKLNGLSYRFDGTVFNGSAIGRAYTARGLQLKKGVNYQPERDVVALASAAERGGIRRDPRERPEQSARRPGQSRDDGRETGLTRSQENMLADIGKFRTVATADLVTYRYYGNAGKFERDMRLLTDRGLAERRVVSHGRTPKTRNVVALTTKGRNLLRRANPKTGDVEPQQFYAGFVKPSEVPHDIGIYRMYQLEAARIEREGGTVRRVVLDFEFKKRVYGELNKANDTPENPSLAGRKETIAERNGLSVVGGRVVLPDLRIEFETRDKEIEKLDLELATGHYKPSQMEAKRAAGLKIYAPASGVGSPAHYDPEIVSGLVSL